MPLTNAQKLAIRKLLTSDEPITRTQVRAIFRAGYERGHEDGNFDHGQNWGDRRDFRFSEMLAGREIDPNEDDNA